MKYRIIFIVLTAFFFYKTSTSQELEVLKSELKNLTGQKHAIQCLNISLLHIEKYGKPDSVLFYSEMAQEGFRKTNDINNLNYSQLYTAIGYQQKNLFDTAIVILNKILKDTKNIPDSLKADIYYYLGIVYYRSGDKKTSLEYFIKAIPLFEKTSNIDGLVLTYCKLADIMVADSQNEEANEYKNKAIALFPKLKRPYAKIFARNILSRAYMDLRFISPTYVDSSIAIAKECYELIKEYGYYTRAYAILNIISDNYFVKNELEPGIQYAKEALKYRKYLYPGEIIMSYVKFSDYYQEKKEYDKALCYLDSFKSQLPLINVQYYWLNYYQRYFQLNKKTGNLSEAIYGLERFDNIKDSIYNVDKSKEINELSQKYDRAENEKKIMTLSKEKEIASINTKFLIAGIIASIFAIIVIIFLYRQTVIKSKLKSIETEQRLNRARMDPHFFFNILSSLRAYTLKENNSAKTADYLTKYSKIMRQTLESSYNEQITIETELDFLNNYFEIQKLRYPGRFDYEVKLADEIEVSELKLPSMIIQPFVENAIEHGFSENKSKGLISLDFKIVSNELEITISDNGIGLITDSKEQKTYPSRATQIVKDRLFLLNKQYKSNARFEINKNQDSGLRVSIFLPLIYSN
ncbi:MAG: histidine kinase [Sphingobacteriaceae bacterium]|nr:histidine kinase [Sphingobacteriaceae bacterium]